LRQQLTGRLEIALRAKQAKDEFFNGQRRQRPPFDRVVHGLEQPRERFGDYRLEWRRERRHTGGRDSDSPPSARATIAFATSSGGT